MRAADTGLHVQRKIIDAIADGYWSEGERIPEARVARMLGVSRTPVRQALQQLVTVGILEQSSNQAPRVRRLSVESLSDLYALRIELEGFAAESAAITATAEQCQSLVDAAEEFNALLDGVQDDMIVFDTALYNRLIEVERNFHQVLNRIANNLWLEQMLEQMDLISMVFLQIRELTLGHPARKRIQRSYKHHLRLAMLIQQGKSEQARAYVKQRLTAAHQEITRRM